jgi:hypothetical protein
MRQLWLLADNKGWQPRLLVRGRFMLWAEPTRSDIELSHAPRTASHLRVLHVDDLGSWEYHELKEPEKQSLTDQRKVTWPQSHPQPIRMAGRQVGASHLLVGLLALWAGLSTTWAEMTTLQNTELPLRANCGLLGPSNLPLGSPEANQKPAQTLCGPI